MPGPPSIPGNAPQVMDGAFGDVSSLHNDNGTTISMEQTKYADGRFTEYGFSLPAGAEITSIIVHYEANNNTGTAATLQLTISEFDSGTVSDVISNTVTSETPTSFETSFLAGNTLGPITATLANERNFGLRIQLMTGSVRVDFDYINLEIKYTTREGMLEITQGQVEITQGLIVL